MAGWKISTILSQVKTYCAIFGAGLAAVEQTRILGVVLVAVGLGITAFQKHMEEQGITDYSKSKR